MGIKPTGWILAGIGLVGGTIAYSLDRAVNTGKKIEAEILPRIERWNLVSLRLLVDAKLTNPTAGTLVIRDSEVKLFHQDPKAPIHETKLPGKAIHIMPKETVQLSDLGQFESPIVMDIPTSDVIRLIPEALVAVSGFGQPFTLNVPVKGKVKVPNLPASPITLKEQITLQNAIG